MVLDRHRSTVEPVLTSVAQRLTWIPPDVFTWLSLLFAFVAGVFFFYSDAATEVVTYYLFFASLFVFLNGLFDALDGKVAKLSGKASTKGDFLDHALDRYADVLMVGGLALSIWCRYPSIGLIAIVGMLLTSYMGTQAQAVGYKRKYSGLLGRADRLVLLMFAPVIHHIFLYYDVSLPWGFNLLEWVLIYFAVVGNITAVQRFVGTLIGMNKTVKK